MIAKSDIQKYNNGKGSGIFFNMEFLDETGKVKATAFNQEVGKFHVSLEIGNVNIPM